MIQHPILAVVSLIFMIVLCSLEIRYYRAGMPQTRAWIITLFLLGSGMTVCGTLTLIPKPMVMFQSIGTCAGMLLIMTSGGIIAIYTTPKAMREAEKNSERLRGR